MATMGFKGLTAHQYSYTVPFTSVHAGQWRTVDEVTIQTTHELNTTQKTQRKTQQNKLAWFSTSYDTRPENEVGDSNYYGFTQLHVMSW